jgi:hypothetical protein
MREAAGLSPAARTGWAILPKEAKLEERVC